MKVRLLIFNASVIGVLVQSTSNEERGIDLWTVTLAGSGLSKFSLVHEAQFQGEMSNKIKSYCDTYHSQPYPKAHMTPSPGSEAS